MAYSCLTALVRLDLGWFLMNCSWLSARPATSDQPMTSPLSLDEGRSDSVAIIVIYSRISLVTYSLYLR
ncbi:hypothetical protein D3C80_2218720 [compost metagenome]